MWLCKHEFRCFPIWDLVYISFNYFWNIKVEPHKCGALKECSLVDILVVIFFTFLDFAITHLFHFKDIYAELCFFPENLVSQYWEASVAVVSSIWLDCAGGPYEERNAQNELSLFPVANYWHSKKAMFGNLRSKTWSD